MQQAVHPYTKIRTFAVVCEYCARMEVPSSDEEPIHRFAIKFHMQQAVHLYTKIRTFVHQEPSRYIFTPSANPSTHTPTAVHSRNASYTTHTHAYICTPS